MDILRFRPLLTPYLIWNIGLLILKFVSAKFFHHYSLVVASGAALVIGIGFLVTYSGELIRAQEEFLVPLEGQTTSGGRTVPLYRSEAATLLETYEFVAVEHKSSPLLANNIQLSQLLENQQKLTLFARDLYRQNPTKFCFLSQERTKIEVLCEPPVFTQ